MLQEKLNNTADKQISTTDTDSRSILITKAIVEVAYNIHNVVDDKHNLIVHTQVTNSNLPAGRQVMARLYIMQPHRQRKIYN